MSRTNWFHMEFTLQFLTCSVPTQDSYHPIIKRVSPKECYELPPSKAILFFHSTHSQTPFLAKHYKIPWKLQGHTHKSKLFPATSKVHVDCVLVKSIAPCFQRELDHIATNECTSISCKRRKRFLRKKSKRVYGSSNVLLRLYFGAKSLQKRMVHVSRCPPPPPLML